MSQYQQQHHQDGQHADFLDSLVEDQLWDQVEQRLRDHPEEARQPVSCSIVNPSRGWTRLHWLCSMGSTPGKIIGLVASLYPHAITLPDRRFGDTPLHIACRNSVTSADKIQSLLVHCQPESILIRNQSGGTPLHSASNHNAVLEALEALIRANDRVLKVTTYQGVHAISALWHAYISTIPGHMCVARVLEGDHVQEGHFDRFWEKCEFLATEYFRRSKTCPTNLDQRQRQFVLHGLMQCNVPINLFKVALKRNPSYALAADAHGRLPLHVMLENRPYRLKEREAVLALLDAAPQAASQPNHKGDTPLAIAIHSKIPWEHGLEEIVQAGPTALKHRDASTGLFPFQLAASIGGKVSIETTYHLLSKQPDLLGA